MDSLITNLTGKTILSTQFITCHQLIMRGLGGLQAFYFI